MHSKDISMSTMTESDIAFATEMTDREKWGYLQEDFRRLIYFEPDGCFVARMHGKNIGMVTTPSYGDYAFLGCLIVKDEFRGVGIGASLMNEAIDYLNKKGVQTIELDSVFPALSLYRPLGFKDKYLSLRLLRPSNDNPNR